MPIFDRTSTSLLCLHLWTVIFLLSEETFFWSVLEGLPLPWEYLYFFHQSKEPLKTFWILSCLNIFRQEKFILETQNGHLNKPIHTLYHRSSSSFSQISVFSYLSTLLTSLCWRSYSKVLITIQVIYCNLVIERKKRQKEENQTDGRTTDREERGKYKKNVARIFNVHSTVFLSECLYHFLAVWASIPS